MTELLQTIEKSEHAYKIIILGSLKVGKSAFLNSFLKDIPHHKTENNLGTISLAAGNFVITNDQVIVKLQIWDSNSTDDVSGNQNLLFEDTMGSIILYDADDRASFDSAKSLCTFLSKDSKIPLILVGNKFKLDPSVVPTWEIQELITEENIRVLEFDIFKDSELIKRCFRQLVTDVYHISTPKNSSFAPSKENLLNGWDKENDEIIEIKQNLLREMQEKAEKEAKQNQDVMNDLLKQLKSQQVEIESLKAIVANNDAVLISPETEVVVQPEIKKSEPPKFFRVEDMSKVNQVDKKKKEEEPIKFFKV